MKQTAYQIVSWDDRNQRQDTALFEHESEARTYALTAAQAGRNACVLKIETEVLDSIRRKGPARRSDQEQEVRFRINACARQE